MGRTPVRSNMEGRITISRRELLIRICSVTNPILLVYGQLRPFVVLPLTNSNESSDPFSGRVNKETAQKRRKLRVPLRPAVAPAEEASRLVLW